MSKYKYDEPLLLLMISKGEEGTTEEKQELCQTIAILWEDIVEVTTYPYDDDYYWIKHAGPKFYITSRYSGPLLVLGEFKEFIKLWTNYIKQTNGEDIDHNRDGGS